MFCDFYFLFHTLFLILKICFNVEINLWSYQNVKSICFVFLWPVPWSELFSLQWYKAQKQQFLTFRKLQPENVFCKNHRCFSLVLAQNIIYCRILVTALYHDEWARLTKVWLKAKLSWLKLISLLWYRPMVSTWLDLGLLFLLLV